jgi:hypothetical protein
VTAATLFRGNTPGDLTGPYLSQFLWLPFASGATRGFNVVQKYRTALPNDDHLTAYSDWLAVQRGTVPTRTNTFDATMRYLRNGRDLGEYLHQEFSFQAFLNANLILLSFGVSALDPNNPYRDSSKQGGFLSFGAGTILELAARVAMAGLKATWYQKWMVHRRLRPEAFGGRVHNLRTGAASYPIHQDLLNSQVLGDVYAKTGTYLLPLAYPEGSPIHPSYPASHAVVAGACVTILKVLYNEAFVIPNPVVASSDGLALQPYTGASLTVGGELNKLASNIAFGRNIAGMHWRSDGVAGLKLGEAVALDVLQNLNLPYTPPFSGCTLTKFDGTVITL